jgi:DNA-binding IclR family transcriptional regulator
MDLIVAACRALANRVRLHLLWALHAHPGTTVKELAKAAGLTPAFTSQQLKLLGNYHFVQATPRGRRVYYHPAKPGHVSNQFLRETVTLLHQTMAQLHPTPCKVWDADHQQKADDAMFKVFTTYTHLRRLLMLRYLALNGASTPAAVMAHVGMSFAAVHRHLTKLQRRGVLQSDGPRPHLWSIATKLPAPMSRNMLAVVLRALRNAKTAIPAKSHTL